MGKIKHKRRKLHATAKANDETVENCVEMVPGIEKQDTTSNAMTLPPLYENPFSGITISQSDLQQKLDINNNQIDPEVEELVKEGRNEQKLNEKHLNKKGKRILRRENFIKKLHVAKAFDEEKKAAKNRAAVPVVGDLKPMALALPEIESIIQNNAPEQTKKRKIKRRKPRRLKRLGKMENELEKYKSINENMMKKIQSKATQKHMLYEIKLFQERAKDPAVKKIGEIRKQND